MRKVTRICLLNLTLSSLFIFIELQAGSQTVVGLDNWFNCENDPATGKPYHYLWTDTAFSGYSEWGDIFKSKGAVLKTVQKPYAEELNKINIYIIADPDSTSEAPAPNYFGPDDIEQIKNWVSRGGVMAVFANDGPNCEFTHLNRLVAVFGMKFNHVTIHRVTGDDFNMGACINLPDHPLFKGVSKIFLKDISDITIKGNAKSILTENGKVLIAETTFGKGYVFAIGDPWIYNEYIDHARLPLDFTNRKAAENLTELLLNHSRTGKKQYSLPVSKSSKLNTQR